MLSKAESILMMLDELTESPTGLNEELDTRVDGFLYRKIQLLLRQGRLGEAKRTIEVCLETCSLGSQDVRSVKFLHQLAEVHMVRSTRLDA